MSFLLLCVNIVTNISKAGVLGCNIWRQRATHDDIAPDWLTLHTARNGPHSDQDADITKDPRYVRRSHPKVYAMFSSFGAIFVLGFDFSV